jgi:hypothetical protein
MLRARLMLVINNLKGGLVEMAQVVECLPSKPSKCETLS